MYFRVKLKEKKPSISCCFTLIVFIEFTFAVPFPLTRETWDDGFVSKVGRWEILRNGEGILAMGGMNLKWWVDTSLRTMRIQNLTH